MKKIFLGRRTQTGCLYGGLLSIIVNLFLTSSTLTPLADTKIVFMSNRGGNGQIYRTNPNWKQLRQFTKYPKSNSVSAWHTKTSLLLRTIESDTGQSN